MGDTPEGAGTELKMITTLLITALMNVAAFAGRATLALLALAAQPPPRHDGDG